MKRTALFAVTAASLLLFGCAAENSGSTAVASREPAETTSAVSVSAASVTTSEPVGTTAQSENSEVSAVYADEEARKLYPEMTYDSVEHRITEWSRLMPMPENTDAYTPVEISTWGVTENESDVPDEIMMAAKGCVKQTESYLYTAKALEKSGGNYILGDYVVNGAESRLSENGEPKKLNEDFSPHIGFSEAIGEDFDGDGKKEWFLSFTYFDLKPEFLPYYTDCCVFVGSDGKAEVIAEKCVFSQLKTVRSDGVLQLMLRGGCNNSTTFTEIYDIRGGKPAKILSEWIADKSENGFIELHYQMCEGYACYDAAAKRYDLFMDKDDYDVLQEEISLYGR